MIPVYREHRYRDINIRILVIDMIERPTRTHQPSNSISILASTPTYP